MVEGIDYSVACEGRRLKVLVLPRRHGEAHQGFIFESPWEEPITETLKRAVRYLEEHRGNLPKRACPLDRFPEVFA